MCDEQIAGTSQLKMTIQEKLQNSRSYKEEGNNLYKAKNYKGAIGKYHRALLFIKGIEKHHDVSNLPGLFGASSTPSRNPLSESIEVELRNLKAGCYNNLAACLLQQENVNYEKVIHYCDEVLSVDPKNVKALYRKGVSYYNLKDYDYCIETLQEAKMCSSLPDASIQRYINLSEKCLHQYKEKEKERYKGMFDKLANTNLQPSA